MPKVRITPFSIPSCVARMRWLQASVWDLRRSGTCVIVGGWPRRPGMVHPIATSNFSIARSHGPLVRRLPMMGLHPSSSRTLPRIRSLANPYTLCPRAKSALTRWRPIKPAPPAIKILSGTAIVSSSAYSRGTLRRESSDGQAVHRAGQAHRTDLIAEVVVGRDPDPDVIVRQPREEARPVAGLEQHGHRLARVPVVELQALGPGERAELFAAGLNGCRGDRTGQLRGGRAATWGIAEHVEIGEGEIGWQRAGVGEGGIGFSRKAHHEIRAEPEVRHRPDRLLDEAGIRPGGVSPVHRVQDAIVAALQGDMEIAAQLRRPGHTFQELVGDRGGFDRRDTDAVDAGNGFQQADHVRQRESVAPVPADVDAGYDHFTMPARHESLGLPENVLRAATAFVPSGEGDDAEGAHEVTAVLHL